MSNHQGKSGIQRQAARPGIRQRWPLAVLACALAAPQLSVTALGQEPEGSYLPIPNPANDYRDAIDRIEGDYGPYATELSDLYLGLGQALFEGGEYEKALDALNRGIMVKRVNSGPNSPEQTNHLYLIANVETLLGNLDAADGALRNIYFVNAEHHGELSPEMLPVLERMYYWYLTTRPPGSDVSDYADYERSIDMAEQMVKISEPALGPADPVTAAAYRRLGEAQFQAVRYLLGQGMVLTMDAYVAVSSRTLDSASVVKVPVGRHYDSGRKAFRQYLEALAQDPSKTPMDVAQAYADLGDWYLAVGKTRNAREHYEQAYQVLAGNAEYAAMAENYLGQPKPVHFFAPPPEFLSHLENPLPAMNLDISMTVTSYGNVRYAQVLNAPEEVPEDVLGDILRLLRETPFRPAMKSGELVTTKDFIWQFAILPPENAS